MLSNMKKTLYIDMDNVLVDFMSAVDKFGGEHIHFGTERFPDWKSVTEYLLKKENIK